MPVSKGGVWLFVRLHAWVGECIVLSTRRICTESANGDGDALRFFLLM